MEIFLINQQKNSLVNLTFMYIFQLAHNPRNVAMHDVGEVA